jgi:hypothetical protein
MLHFKLWYQGYHTIVQPAKIEFPTKKVLEHFQHYNFDFSLKLSIKADR